jgi:HAD superfamily hydrolase (TIGR01509 family)
LARVKAEEYGRQENSIQPIPEVVEFARSLHGRFALAVAPGSRKFDVERSLQRLHLASLFSVVLTPADVVHGKPEPDMFLLAAQHLGVAPDCCLVLEDGESGFEAARRARMDFLVVLPAVMPIVPLVE